MEEADTLCDRIGIMARGRLRCLGTQQHLKSRFGEGFKLSLTMRSPVMDAGPFVREKLCSSARLVHSVGATRIYMLPTDDGVDIASVFETMLRQRESAGITDWGFSQASLEEVFVTIARNSEEE